MLPGTQCIGVFFNFIVGSLSSFFIYGLGNLDLKHILLKLSTKCYISMQLSNNLVIKQLFEFFKYSEFIKFSCVSRWIENFRFYAVNSLVYDAFKLSVLYIYIDFAWYTCNLLLGEFRLYL